MHKKSDYNFRHNRFIFSAPEGSRTPNLLIRSQMLYPVQTKDKMPFRKMQRMRILYPVQKTFITHKTIAISQKKIKLREPKLNFVAVQWQFIMDKAKPDNPIQVVIAEDQTIVAEGLAVVLEKSKLYKVVGIASNGEHLLHLLNSVQPQIILLDLNMPVMDGFKACKIIREKFPSIIVIALTMYNDEKVIKQVKEAGAAGMLLKLISSGQLLQKLNEIVTTAANESFITIEDINTKAPEESVSPSDSFLSEFKITVRELEIMRLIAQGLETEKIAAKLFLSTHTVTTHRRNVLSKLDLKNSVEMVNFLRKRNLV